MLGHRPLTPEDYGAILKRRWWVIVVPLVLLPIIAYAATYFIPPQYVSQTLVLVEQQKVPESYVKPVITEDLDSRLATMREQILSRSRLAPVIDQHNLYAGKGLSMDDRVDRARKAIGIKGIQSDITRGLPGFYISFTASDPHTAQIVCGDITSLFVSENLHARAASAEGTTAFLKGQLDDAKAKLDEQAAKLAKFQQEYAGRLPDEQATNLSMTGTLSTQLDATTQALTRMEQEKSYAEAILSQQVAQQNAQLGEHGVAPQTQQTQLEQLEEQEAQLLTRYTDDYPDVIAVKRKIKELQATMAKAPAPAKAPVSTAPSRNDSAGVLQLRAQLRAMDIGIAQKKSEQARIQGQLRMYQDRIASSPAVQEQYKSITRDNQTAQQFYDDLLSKMNSSQMATDLERRQQGEQFTVMDEPNLPESPTFPKRGVFVAGGIAGGLALGLLLTGLFEYKDTAMRSERDIWAFTKLPTLAVIEFEPELDQSRQHRRWFRRSKPETTSSGKPLVNVGG